VLDDRGCHRLGSFWGPALLILYADDAVIVFSGEDDACRVRDVSLELVDLFLRDGLRLPSAVGAAAAGKDTAAVRRLCHELLGVCASVGAQRAAALTRELQQAAKAEDIDAVARGLPAVEEIITDTHRVFKKALGVSVDPAVQA